jgi:amino acid permease
VYGYGALIVSAQILLDMGPNHKQFPKATIVAHICTTSIYLIFGAFGYGAFGTAPPPSFLSPDSLIYDEYRTNWAIGAAFTVTNLTVTIPIFINSLNRGLVLILPKDKQESWPWVYGFRTFVVLAIMALSCTPVSYFDDLTGLIPMCTVAMINILFPILYWWACLEHEYALEHDEPKWSCLWKVIKPRMWYFWLHMLVAFVIVIAVIFGFWTSLESLIDNIEGNN